MLFIVCPLNRGAAVIHAYKQYVERVDVGKEGGWNRARYGAQLIIIISVWSGEHVGRG